MNNNNLHSFYVPVMGIGYTADTAIKISHYGISSVISLVDDQLLEKLGNYYSSLFKKDYELISEKEPNKRALRITKYLNLVNEIVSEKYDNLIKTANTANSEFLKLLRLLPEQSIFKKDYEKMIIEDASPEDIQKWIRNSIKPGSIDVNIMTKLNRKSYNVTTKEELPSEFDDANAALRGYAESNLHSSIILSAGLSPRLYSYMGNFKDFYPDNNGYLKKKIVLKVSDYRSALIQSKFLAKKGLWVSEYRIESGLNCGGHAFATDGLLAGNILEEFKNNRKKLLETNRKNISPVLEKKGYPVDVNFLNFQIVYQSGVGTSDEHNMLLDYYEMDQVGWASPFLLVPEVVAIDKDTLNLVANAKEEDFFLSGASPLGVLFNNIKGASTDVLRDKLIAKGTPGSACPKKYLTLNNEFGEKAICASSKIYLKQKLPALEKSLKANELTKDEYIKAKAKALECSCICVGLGVSALKSLNIKRTYEGEEISICPGPNTAYFNREYSLEEMVDNIYGRTTIVDRNVRPNLFMKELKCYIDYMNEQLYPNLGENDIKGEKALEKFKFNLHRGVEYYKDLINDLKGKYDLISAEIERDLDNLEQQIDIKPA